MEKKVTISDNEVKVGDYCVINDFRDDTFYDKIIKISTAKDKCTNNTYTEITTKNDYKFSLETYACINNKYVTLVEFARDSEEVKSIKNTIRRAKKMVKRRETLIAEDISNYIQQNILNHKDIHSINVSYNSNTGKCRVNISSTDTDNIEFLENKISDY